MSATAAVRHNIHVILGFTPRPPFELPVMCPNGCDVDLKKDPTHLPTCPFRRSGKPWTAREVKRLALLIAWGKRKDVSPVEYAARALMRTTAACYARLYIVRKLRREAAKHRANHRRWGL
jgi:hypothetical protein